MRSVNLTLLSLAILAFLFATTYAQNRTIVTLGGSWWNAAYSYETQDGEKIADIGTGNMFGPYLSISRGKLNLGASLLFGSFPIDALGLMGDEDAADLLDDVNMDMSRNDLNFSVGYRIHRNLNLFVGVKSLKWEIDGTITASTEYYDYWTDTWYTTEIEADVNETESGTMLGGGISAVLPLGSGGLYAFGSLAYMAGVMELSYDFSSEDYSESSSGEELDAQLVAINLGVGYRFPSGFGLNIGYRADLFNEKYAEESLDEEPRIGVRGAILTASYSF
jgi:hypothetical protein